MRFKFCGNIDSPEWLISEITFLTKISAIRLRMLCNNIVNFILNNGKNFKDIQKSFDDMNFNDIDGKIIFSLLDFILRNSIKFEVEENILTQELQQLGLPLENADSITKVYKTQKENLKIKLKNEIFSINEINNLDYKISYILASDINDFKNNNLVKNIKEDKKIILESDVLQLNNVETKITLNIDYDITKNINVTTNVDLIGKLLNDLTKASEMIKKFQDS